MLSCTYHVDFGTTQRKGTLKNEDLGGNKPYELNFTEQSLTSSDPIVKWLRRGIVVQQPCLSLCSIHSRVRRIFWHFFGGALDEESFNLFCVKVKSPVLRNAISLSTYASADTPEPADRLMPTHGSTDVPAPSRVQRRGTSRGIQRA